MPPEGVSFTLTGRVGKCTQPARGIRAHRVSRDGSTGIAGEAMLRKPRLLVV